MSSLPLRFLLVSFATLCFSIEAATLVPQGAAWRMFKGRSEPSSPADAWRQAGFADAGWIAGSAPFYYGETVAGGTLLTDMQNQYSTIFLRHRFEASSISNMASLTLDVRCDDGFAVWLNGRLVASNNVPASFAYNALAPANATEPAEFAAFNISNPAAVLAAGANLLAVQVFNVSLSSSDLLFDAQLFSTDRETDPPRLVGVVPFPGAVTNLTQVTVTFSEPVQGVTAGSLRINDQPATNVLGSGATYVFQFPQPAYGPVQFAWSLDAVITDFATPPNLFERNGANASFLFDLIDSTAPFVAATHPPPNATVRELAQFEVTFSKPVEGVDPADLLVNGRPATAVSGLGLGPFVFDLPELSDGPVSIEWAAQHGITGENGRFMEPSAWRGNLDRSRALSPIRINELSAANLNGIKDEDGSAEDWIELHNQGDAPVNLLGWSLSDNRDDPGRWVFPSMVIPARGYLIVFASAKDRKAGPRPHTNFKLSEAGEYLGLFSPDSPRAEASSLDYPEQRNDVSYGLSAAGEWRYFRAASAGQANGASSIAGITEPVYFSVKRGFFAAPFHLTLHCATPGAKIRYTLNGSEPTETTGTEYTGPIRIDRTQAVRAASFHPNQLPSRTETHTYLYAIPASRTRLPVLSLVTATNHLYGTNGIMEVSPRNTTKRGRAWERPVSVELIQPADNSGFQVNAGIRLQGGDFIRSRYNYKITTLPDSKYSYRLYFRGDYGASKLKYPMIPGIPIEEFDELALRAGMNDHSNPFIRDELARALSSDVGIVASHGTFVHLYLNGVYKGLYNPTERIGPEFLQAWHGGGEKWDIIAQLNETVEGDMMAWNRMRSIAINQNPTNPVVFQQIQSMLDVTNYVDYLLTHIYADTDDWPHNNWRAAREKTPEGKFRFYIWDAEFSFGFNNVPASHNTIVNQLSSMSPPWGTTEFQRFYNRIKLSPEFKLIFADRVHKHMFNGGALTDERIRARYQQLRAQVAPSISNFDESIGTTYIPQRRRHLTNHLQQAGFLASSNAPVFSQFGGRVAPGYLLSMSAGAGQIFYTTNGIDPRVPFTGETNAAAQLYARPVALGADTVVKARTRWAQTNWSALTEASFRLSQLGSPLRFTELMYNPPGGDAYEFIELQNAGGVPVSLGGFTLEGVSYRFGTDDLPLDGGERIVLASDANPALFRQRHPGVAVRGYFGGSLNNGGEMIALKDRDGNIVAAVEYGDEGAWPEAADGGGHSLELADAHGEQGSPANWHLSATAGGSPGAQNSARPESPVRFHEVFAGGAATNPAALASDFIELVNQGESEADLSGWSLADGENLRPFVFPEGARLGPGAFLVVYCAGSTNTDPARASFGLSQKGETLALLDARGHRIDALSYGLQIAGHSSGRGELGGEWTLTAPTPGAPNEAAALSRDMVINEVMANSARGEDDWLELHNLSSNAPAAIGGFYLTMSNAVARLAGLSFIEPGGFLRIWADEQLGPEHLAFKLPAAGATLRLSDETGAELNAFAYASQREGVSYGRLPDGSGQYSLFFASASPGAANYLAEAGIVRLSEMLVVPAEGQGGLSWIELFNTSNAPVSLAGYRLRKSGGGSAELVFGSNAVLGATSRLLIACNPSRPASDTNLPSALDPTGGEITLHEANGRVSDSVRFGLQARGLSIGDDTGVWSLLAMPTPGQANSAAAALGDPGKIRINEWLAAPMAGDDWIELHNPQDDPVHLGGMVLTDNPSIFSRTNGPIPRLSFIAPRGYALLQADGEIEKGADHLPFGLDAFGETVRLYSGLVAVDEVVVLPQLAGISEGRSPDASTNIVRFSFGTPGASNPVPSADADGDGMPDDWESVHGLNPANPSDAASDADGDGAAALAEFRAGTDPRSAGSVLKLTARNGAAGVELLFTAAEGRSYSIMAADPVDSPDWERLASVPSGPARTIVIPAEPATEARFYRVVTPMLP